MFDVCEGTGGTFERGWITVKLRTAWKIILRGSDSNHREGTKIKAWNRALGPYITSLSRESAAEHADMVRYACKTMGAKR